MIYYWINKKTKEHRAAKSGDFGYSHDWNLVEADADGWIEFNQDECPLPGESEFEAKSSNGRVVYFRQAKSCMNWRAVRFYRPILPTPEPKPEWRGPADGLPPVGSLAKTAGGNCEVLAVDEGRGKIAVRWYDGELGVVNTACVIPRPTEEDEAVERMEGLVYKNWVDSPKDVARALYRAGLRFTD